VEGTHYFRGLSPALIAYKLLAVNLSDLAAMGARPKWAMFSVTLEEYDDDFIGKFSVTLNDSNKRYGVELVGGDFNQGPNSFSLAMMGLLPEGLAMTRRNAKPGDRVFCSGYLGDAALALTKLNSEQELSDKVFEQVLPALHMPTPRVTLGQRLLVHASACVDMSDGLVGDASHIARCSKVSLEIDIKKLPLSDAYKTYMAEGGFLRYAVAGGDDYELLFTIEESKVGMLETIAKDLDTPLTEIGVVQEKKHQGVILVDDGKETNIRPKGFQHFT
ncbi:MAG: thiamine-phosphate kinase, partial [Acidiferrobacterales bacterium]|nr:thiamine-phosphate kinase [Acidiferrobacterales bacterium]